MRQTNDPMVTCWVWRISFYVHAIVFNLFYVKVILINAFSGAQLGVFGGRQLSFDVSIHTLREVRRSLTDHHPSIGYKSWIVFCIISLRHPIYALFLLIGGIDESNIFVIFINKHGDMRYNATITHKKKITWS